jgi:hypothetical protein
MIYDNTPKIATEAKPEYATRGDISWLSDRINSLSQEVERVRKKNKLLIALMVDKGLIGEELATILINETYQETSQSKIDWLMEELGEK